MISHFTISFQISMNASLASPNVTMVDVSTQMAALCVSVMRVMNHLQQAKDVLVSYSMIIYDAGCRK